VAFQPELVLEGLEGALDPLPDAVQRPVPGGSSARSGRRETAPWPATTCSKSWPANPLSARMASPGRSRGRSWPSRAATTSRSPSLGWPDTRPQAARPGRPAPTAGSPEPAVVARAVAVAGMAGQGRAVDRLAGGRTRHRGRVDQAELVAPAWRVGGDVLEREGDQGRGPTQPPVVGRGSGEVREQMPQPAAAKRSQRRSLSNPSSTWATANQTSSASLSLA
jgi:hypothetical protein